MNRSNKLKFIAYRTFFSFDINVDITTNALFYNDHIRAEKEKDIFKINIKDESHTKKRNEA